MREAKLLNSYTTLSKFKKKFLNKTIFLINKNLMNILAKTATLATQTRSRVMGREDQSVRACEGELRSGP